MTDEQRFPGRPRGTKERMKSDIVRELRMARGWSQQRLAQELGCSIALVTKCERAGEVPSRGEIPERLRSMAKESGLEWPAGDGAGD